MLLGHDALHALQLLALVGDFAGRAVVVHHVEGVAGLRGSVQTQHLHGGRGTRFEHLFAVLVEHRLHAARVNAREHHVAYAQGSVLHEDGSHVAAALVERRLDHGTRGLAVGVGLQVEHLGLEQHLLQQLVEVQTLLGRNVLALVFAAPLLHEVVHLGQLLLDMLGVGAGLVDLVDGEYHRDAGRLGVVDRLGGLGHHAVVGRHDDDGDVGDLGAAGAHGGEGLVARRVEEGDLLSVELHAVGTDVLRDTAGLALDDVGLADVVQQRGLTVVDVAHDRDDRGARYELILVVLLLVDRLLNLHRDEFDLEAELLGHDHERLGVESLVDRYHQTQVHAGRDDLRDRDVHHGRQLADGHELGHLERGTLHLLALELLVHALGYQFALLLAVLRTLVLGTLGRQTGQRVLYLLRYLLVAHFGADDGFRSLVLILVLAALSRLGLVGVVAAVAAARLAALAVVLTAALATLLLLGAVHVDLLLL